MDQMSSVFLTEETVSIRFFKNKVHRQHSLNFCKSPFEYFGYSPSLSRLLTDSHEPISIPDTHFESDNPIKFISQGISLAEWREVETRGDGSTIINRKIGVSFQLRYGNSDETIHVELEDDGNTLKITAQINDDYFDLNLRCINFGESAKAAMYESLTTSPRFIVEKVSLPFTCADIVRTDYMQTDDTEDATRYVDIMITEYAMEVKQEKQKFKCAATILKAATAKKPRSH